MKNYTWYNKKLNLDSPEAVHQVLIYGGLAEIDELKDKLGAVKIREIFSCFPYKGYTPADFNFIKNFILKIEDPLDDKRYLQTTPRDIRR